MANWWPRHTEEEVAAASAVLRSGATNYWSGVQGQSFEREWAEYTGAKHALAVSNGTTALEVALHALRLPPGSEIIVPARTFMATASACVTAGHKPVLADIDARTLNVTAETLEARRTPATKAVIVVHYAGLPCDMPSIMGWAIRNGLLVLEDCAHAHGARIGGEHVGTFGAIGTFSMCIGKIMTTGGEGGAVITNDDALHKNMAARRDHGRFQMIGSRDMTKFTYEVMEYGSNIRQTEMQSAIARVQLRGLDAQIARRREIAVIYDSALEQEPQPLSVRYMYMARSKNKYEILNRVPESRFGGCPNLGKEPVFRGEAAPCPVADATGEEVFALPIYPTMSDAEVADIAKRVKELM